MKLIYRPEIDGLRAIAVVAVILYHAGKTVEGGFIGVDIFFVISGYLITSLIIKELAVKKSFSFRNFYLRRARRILPALLVVMVVSALFSWAYLLPYHFVQYAKSLISSLLFSSNFYFWFTGEQYNAVSSLYKPLLHTWSLSVEEQFYILYPILLITCIRYFKNHLTTIILAGGLYFSLISADSGSITNPAMSFYILPMRAWELLAGALLAKLEIDFGRTHYKFLSQTLPILGLALILHSIIFFDDQMRHPSFYTLSPIIGAMLIIWFANKDDWASIILSSKLLVGLGLISYSLYLWHYPIITFNALLEFTAGSFYWEIFLALLLIYLSGLTYFVIERPFRNRQLVSTKTFATTISLASIILVVFSSLVIQGEGYYQRLSGLMTELSRKDLNMAPYAILQDENGQCFGRNFHPQHDFCTFISDEKKGEVFLLGDSLMASISSFLKEPLLKSGFSFTSMTAPSCWYLPDFDRIDPNTGKPVKECDEKLQNDRKQKIVSSPNSIVILGGRFHDYLISKTYVASNNNMTMPEGLIKSTQQLLNANHKVILVYPIPCAEHHIVHELNKASFSINDIKPTPYSKYMERTKQSYLLFDSIQHPNLYRVYPHKLFCNNQIKGSCVSHDDKNIFYVDTDHPSTAGAKMIVELIMKKIDAISPIS
jgi:peptidoglycan/LPS O-acetylase OafA/YrhL